MKKGKIILVGGEKGGTGKTTLATNLAVCRARAGHDIMLIDTDPQASLSLWQAERSQNLKVQNIACVQKYAHGLIDTIKDLSERYEDILIDAGGRDSKELRAAMTQAEFFISPIQPSQFDVWTIKKLTQLIDEVRIVNPNLKVFIVISRGSNNVKVQDSEDAIAFFKEYYPEFIIINTVIHDRSIYRKAASNGLGVIEMDDQKAIYEVMNVYEEIFNEGSKENEQQ